MRVLLITFAFALLLCSCASPQADNTPADNETLAASASPSAAPSAAPSDYADPGTDSGTIDSPVPDAAPYVNSVSPSPSITQEPAASTAPSVSEAPALPPDVTPDSETPEPATPSPAHKNIGDLFSYKNLIDLSELDGGFLFDLRFASTNNFTNKRWYDAEICLIHKDTAKALLKAQKLFMEDGYRLKIWDVYRPLSVQQGISDALPANLKKFVPPPSNTSQHCRGIALDCTLVDSSGEELKMPTPYLEFSDKAYPNYKNLPKDVIKNREYLINTMKKAGFKVLNVEWWHFYLPNVSDYKRLDFPHSEFINARSSAGQ